MHLRANLHTALNCSEMGKQSIFRHMIQSVAILSSDVFVLSLTRAKVQSVLWLDIKILFD